MCRWNSGEAKHHEQGLESHTGNIEHQHGKTWPRLLMILLDDNKKINLCSPAVVRSKTMSGAESEPIIASRALQTWKEASQECETVLASQFWYKSWDRTWSWLINWSWVWTWGFVLWKCMQSSYRPTLLTVAIASPIASTSTTDCSPTFNTNRNQIIYLRIVFMHFF